MTAGGIDAMLGQKMFLYHFNQHLGAASMGPTDFNQYGYLNYPIISKAFNVMKPPTTKASVGSLDKFIYWKINITCINTTAEQHTIHNQILLIAQYCLHFRRASPYFSRFNRRSFAPRIDIIRKRL